MKKELTIGIDCRLAGRQHAGIGRYIENLITRLPVEAPEIQWRLFFFDQSQREEIFGKVLPKNVTVSYAPVRHYSVREQFLLPKIFGRAKLDLLHVPHFNVPLFYRGRMIITIHDLLWHQYKGTQVTTLPVWQYWIKHLAYTFVVGQAVRKATQILVPAETIKKTVIQYYPSTQHKIVVTKEGVEACFQPKKSMHVATSGVKNLLYVGSLYPHKNVRIIIDALPKLSGFVLQVVGARNVFQTQLREYVKLKGMTKQVQFLGYVPDDELMALYADAFALVQPSFSEGFGLTGVEAMAAGVPVIASNIPIFQEIYQDGAVFFDPNSWESFIQAARKLEKASRPKLIAQAKKIVAQYSWTEMVKKTLQAYEHILA